MKVKAISLDERCEAVREAIWRTAGNALDMPGDWWPELIYDGYAIVRRGQLRYRANYSMADGVVVVRPVEEWIEVEREWAPKGVGVKSVKGSTVTVAGYGVRFGEVDLTGDTFQADTDFRLDLVPAKPVLYDHTLTGLEHDLGTVKSVQADERGLWIEAQLDRSREYVDEVLKLIEAGVLGWSSGSIAHLVRRERGVIKSWPVAEFSLTPTPAEPRTLGVQRLKALAEADPRLQALVPQDEGDSSAGATERAAAAKQLDIQLSLLEIELWTSRN